jgi:hypothetical protein
MARKLLIIIALIIAAFPYFGFTHTTDTTVTTVLGLFMAAVLLFSKRPKILPSPPQENPSESKPSPFSPSMHELPVTHPKEESFMPVISTPTPVPFISPGPTSIPSPVQTPVRKRVRAVAQAHSDTSIPEIEAAQAVRSELPRRSRKVAPRITLSEEERVQPADVPTHTKAISFEEPHVEAHS